jgi:glycosyltransferase involved in cell wall biosynthesis
MAIPENLSTAPTLSVLITYFNEKTKLTRCLASILQQQPPVAEVLIHDDASSFPAQDYVPNDPRIRIIRALENRGPSRARNLLAHEAQSEFVHFHDSDDWFEPSWSAGVHAQLGSATDVVYTDISSVFGDGAPYGHKILTIGKLTDPATRIAHAIASSLLVPSSTIRRQFLLDIGCFRDDLHQSEDYEFNVRLLAANPNVAIVEQALVTIEVHENSRSKDTSRVYTDALKALHEIRKYCPGHDQELADAAANFGYRLFRAGLVQQAREGFQLASKLGPARFANRSGLFRWLAKWFGQEFAERVSSIRQQQRA